MKKKIYYIPLIHNYEIAPNLNHRSDQIQTQKSLGHNELSYDDHLWYDQQTPLIDGEVEL